MKRNRPIASARLVIRCEQPSLAQKVAWNKLLAKLVVTEVKNERQN